MFLYRTHKCKGRFAIFFRRRWSCDGLWLVLYTSLLTFNARSKGGDWKLIISFTNLFAETTIPKNLDNCLCKVNNSIVQMWASLAMSSDVPDDLFNLTAAAATQYTSSRRYFNSLKPCNLPVETASQYTSDLLKMHGGRKYLVNAKNPFLKILYTLFGLSFKSNTLPGDGQLCVTASNKSLLVYDSLHSHVSAFQETFSKFLVQQEAVRCCTCPRRCYLVVGTDDKVVYFSLVPCDNLLRWTRLIVAKQRFRCRSLREPTQSPSETPPVIRTDFLLRLLFIPYRHVWW